MLFVDNDFDTKGQYNRYMIGVRFINSLSQSTSHSDDSKVAHEFVKVVRRHIFDLKLDVTSLKENGDPVLSELNQNYVSNSNFTDVYLVVKKNKHYVMWVGQLVELYRDNPAIRSLGYDICKAVLLHALHATQKKTKMIHQSAYLKEVVEVLKYVLPILAKLIDVLPRYMLNCTEIFPMISSYEANMILSDIYNFCKKSISERDAKYRFNSVMQSNISTLASKFYLLKSS